MDDGRQRENGRHKPDQYKAVHTQWMMPQHQTKDQNTIKLMTIMAERDNAVQERNLALSEKKAALAERDMAILQRDAAISERNNAIMERDSALAALKYAYENGVNSNGGPPCPRGTKHTQNHHNHLSHIHPSLQFSDSPNNQTRDMQISEAYPISSVGEGVQKPRRAKRPRKETKVQVKAPKTPAKSRRGGGEFLNRHSSAKSQNEDASVRKHEWRGQDLSLNQVSFDETTMPAPVCSCTGDLKQCYKWGNGGWQSACCTTTMSMYPLPVVPNKRHARVGGRKMSGGAFTKLLSRLASEGYDLSAPLDLKDHWAKHGTNRYITIK